MRPCVVGALHGGLEQRSNGDMMHARDTSVLSTWHALQAGAILTCIPCVLQANPARRGKRLPSRFWPYQRVAGEQLLKTAEPEMGRASPCR